MDSRALSSGVVGVGCAGAAKKEAAPGAHVINHRQCTGWERHLFILGQWWRTRMPHHLGSLIIGTDFSLLYRIFPRTIMSPFTTTHYQKPISMTRHGMVCNTALGRLSAAGHPLISFQQATCVPPTHKAMQPLPVEQQALPSTARTSTRTRGGCSNDGKER